MRKWLFLILISVVMVGFAGEKEVLNGKEPVGNGSAIQFIEDLRFGGDDKDPNTFWPSPSTNLAVDHRGHIFVADTSETRILEFDNLGGFVKVLAAKGQGPGELPHLSSFQIFGDGSAVAFGIVPGALPTFHFFDEKLGFQKKLAPGRLGAIPGSAVFSPRGNLFYSSFTRFDMKNFNIVIQTGILDLSWKNVKEFSQFQQPFEPNSFNSPQGFSRFLTRTMAGRAQGQGIVAFDKDGNAYCALSNKYEITKWDPTLTKRLLTIKKEHDPIILKPEQVKGMLQPYKSARVFSRIVNDAFVDDFASTLDMTMVKPPIFGMMVTEEGHLLVIHDLDTVNGRQVAHIFNKEGRFTGQVSLDNWAFLSPFSVSASIHLPKMVFKNGYAYTIETDENEDQFAVRYRLEH